MKRILLITTLFSSLIFSSAQAQFFSNKKNADERLDKIEEQLSAFERVIYDKQSPSESGGQKSRAQAIFEVRLTEIEEQMRRITGRLEEQEFSTRQLNKKLDGLSGAIEQKFAELNNLLGEIKTASAEAKNAATEARNTAEKADLAIKQAKQAAELIKTKTSDVKATALVDENSKKEDTSVENIDSDEEKHLIEIVTKGKPVIAEPASSKPASMSSGLGDPEGEYNDAFNLLKQEKYEEASKAFIAFLTKFPEHSLAGNSYYWLGETFYARSNFEQASIFFMKGYTKLPKGNKAPDNLLKLAMSLGQLGKKDEACTTLVRLDKEFPSTSTAIKQGMEKEIIRLGCS